MDAPKFTTDVVIGLEIHAELATGSKLFCGCRRAALADEKPNTRTCPVCLGHPGSKPVLNRKAVDYALRLALATGSEISKELVFSRKSYFYPDMAKNYQITQYELPLARKGKISLGPGKDISLTRIHIEEDPAAIVHPAGMHNSQYVLVDYNRSGDPLVEIVTEPELASPQEARDFLRKLISILKYLKIYDVGSCILKADANISIRESGYTRVEIKNITGFKEIERALNYELLRQKKAVKENEKLVQETRAWDALAGLTRAMRTKETEEDYGYIVDPDLVITDITDDWVREARDSLPELSHEKKERYVRDLGLKDDDAMVLSAEIEMAELYEKVAEKIDAGLAARWLRRELARVMNYSNIEFSELKIDESHLVQLLDLVQKKEITDQTAQKILEKLVAEPFDVREYVKKEGLLAVSDKGELERICREVISEQAKVVDDYRNGNENSLNFLMGQVMRKSKGTASPAQAKEMLKKLTKH